MVKIRILEKTGCFLDSDNKSHYQMGKPLFLDMFFPEEKCEIVPEEEKADICVFSIQLQDKSLLRSDEINILISLENCSNWPFYSHYNKYGDYENDMVDVFIYNHKNKLVENLNFLSIPTVYFRLDYFESIKNKLSVKKPFKEKHFCLVINKSGLNTEISELANILKKYGKVEHISFFDTLLSNKSCYNDPQLLEVLSLFKFIICFENSYTDGYITEKIFNCFLAGTIPIYKGAPDIKTFINTESFINPRETDFLDKIIALNKSEVLYDKMVNSKKITDFSYRTYINKYIKKYK
jgi:hypothetical protein